MGIQALHNNDPNIPPAIQSQTDPLRSLVSLLPKKDSPPSSPSSLADRAQAFSNTLPLEVRNSLIEAVIRTLFSEAEKLPLISEGATGTQDMIANTSSFVRVWMPECVSAQAMGVTTGVNTFQGSWAAYKAQARFRSAHAIGDRGGMIEGGIDTIRGGGQSIGGAAYLGYRGTMIAADIRHLDTSTIHGGEAVGRAACVLGIIGIIAFALFYAMLTLWSCYGLGKDWQFSAELKGKVNELQQFEFLMRKVKAEPKAKLEELATYLNGLPLKKQYPEFRAIKNIFSNNALDVIADHLIRLEKEGLKADKSGEDRRPHSKTEARDLLEMLFIAKDEELRCSGDYAKCLSSLGLLGEDQNVKNFNFSALELIGFKLQEIKRQSKKDAKISRVTSSECVEAVKKAASRHLSERLESNDANIRAVAEGEVKLLTAKVISANKINKVIHSFMIAIGILGIILTVLSFIGLSPAGVIAVTVISALIAVAFKATDGYFMYQGWKKGPPGIHDRKYLLVISLLVAAGLITSISTTLFFGLPLLPLIGALIIGGGGFGLSGVAYYKLTSKEKQWQEDHHNPDVFKKILEQLPSEADEASLLRLDEETRLKKIEEIRLEKIGKTTALFKKLPKAQRQAVRAKYFDMSKGPDFRFKQGQYLNLDSGCKFGVFYISPDNMLEAGHKELLTRGMKKTTKLYWKQWEMEKTEENKKIALDMQALLDAVRQLSDKGDIKEKLNVIKNEGHKEVFKRLQEDVWYVVKRDESLADLKKVITAVAPAI
jgi:hypothetical protein